MDHYKFTRENADQYARSLIEASLDPFITINPKGKITDMNEALATITGKTRNELLNTDFANYFTDPEEARKVYEEVFTNGFVKNYPLTLKDREYTDVLFNGSLYKGEYGKPRRIIRFGLHRLRHSRNHLRVTATGPICQRS